MMLAPHIVTKVLSCIRIVLLLAPVVFCSRTPINFSFRGGVVMAWLEWCPDPQQPDAQWVKIFHPGPWTPQEEHHEFDSGYSPDHLSVATQSTALTMSPELLDAILRSLDAADFSTEELTRLQEGISQQLTARARLVSHPHQPVRALRGSTSLETIGVSDPYRPVNPSDSGRGRMSPVFELTED